MHSLPDENHDHRIVDRREALLRGGAGFGAVVLSYLLQADPLLARPRLPAEGLRPTHLPARAKNVIFLFMEGGPSHLDTFDPKPALNRFAGQPLPPQYERVITAMGEMESPLLASHRTWQQHGQSGLWVSDWLPHLAGCVDDLAVIRSCWTDAINHSGGVCQMNTCTQRSGRPSLGAWVSYGLGTENQNLPAFVVIEDNLRKTTNGPRNWSAGFMPAAYQGAALQGPDEPIPYLRTPREVGPARQAARLDYLQKLNRRHAAARPQQSELDARIKSFELAWRMQAAAPEAVDLAAETAATHRLYGIDQPATEVFGRNCLLARRLVERGVRFVQLYHGAGSKWDAHAGIEANHTTMCRSMDQPVAGLLNDLKQRGLLDETLVVWGGEFGRTPMSEKGDGRDHNPTGFTMWMAGGGVRGGQTIGTTDDFGLHAVEDRAHVRDLHATILYLLGLDHMQLTYLYQGRPERPTINEGAPLEQISI